MKGNAYLKALCVFVAAAILANCVALANSMAEAKTAFSGRAFAAFVSTPLTGPVYLADTGELSANGGMLTSGLLSADVPGILSASVLNSSTSGSHGESNSNASLADVTAFPGSPYQLTVSFLRSQSKAHCEGSFGTSEIVALSFAGQNVVVTGMPNQTITIPGVATLVINEQMTTTSGNYHETRVNAIHLTVNGVGEVILASVKSDIKCVRDDTGPCFDFVTGGGWIIATNGKKGNFGLNAGLKPNRALTAHAHYIDHGLSMKVKATGITAYGGAGNTRTFSGPCEINGSGGFTYTCVVADNGEPGTADTFLITLSNGYSAQGTLQGGNIQLHKPCGDLNP